MTFSKLSLISFILLGISGLVSCSVIEQFAGSNFSETSGTECYSDGSFGERELHDDYRGSSMPKLPPIRTECGSDDESSEPQQE